VVQALDTIPSVVLRMASSCVLNHRATALAVDRRERQRNRFLQT